MGAISSCMYLGTFVSSHRSAHTCIFKNLHANQTSMGHAHDFLIYFRFFLILNSEFRSSNLYTLSVTLVIEFVSGENSCLFIGCVLMGFFFVPDT